MTTFQDGPAQGQHLMLRRAPVFLRVTCDRAGKYDALDQLDDEPLPEETLHAYRLTDRPGSCHLSCRGKGGRTGGFYTVASYELVPVQPTDDEMRDANAWTRWCVQNLADVAPAVKVWMEAPPTAECRD